MLAEGYRVTAHHQASHWWYLSRRDLFLRQVRRAARERGHPGRSLSLLDYGCASGFDLPFLGELGTAEGADVAGVKDKLAAADGGEGQPSRHAIHEVPRDLPRLRGRFDVVTCLDVLEHLDDDVEGLRTVGSLLAPGGQVVVTVPAYGWLWSGEDVISEHRRRYTRGRLLRACRAAGFQVLFASYFNLTLLPAMAAVVWARRLLRRDWRSRSNLSADPWPLRALLRAVTAFEARWVGDEWLPLPAGASVVCRLRLGDGSGGGGAP
jgi:2-polyprenyl-3-methyl-5-hydroxy-6-metoxy-1,4-benzoquinol methylase